ncbi:hypothetical protein HYPSUDRAFT_42884 [Hypholoma sublateritium FD-334 SS-4]|uniref:Uncharacterized protein n=1 Tax=Hypholoma sublateritium (strain FD-334 SS-4) TaxID=945553 RepID=A0A0D2PLJ5_HYPSF|nr:hypothetical protein HYPSUDRAFT_42884 [Hypholoma sublateritium FD-334 SS-4]
MAVPSAEDVDAYNTAAYLRITSIAIAAYSYLETQPTAWKFYREHWESRRLTISVVLFALLRFASITVLAISSAGFFYSRFTLESCRRFFLLPPAFKVIQSMVSQAILGVRTFNLSRRSRTVGWFLISVYIAACTIQWASTMVQRSPQVGDVKLNCRAFNQPRQLGAYVFYAVAIVYDTITTSLSVWYLLKYKFKSSSSVMMKLSKMMIYDGLGYLVLLTGVNILNLVLYKESQEVQTAGASLGYSVSWIMSQKLLIHLYDASRERREEEDFDDAAITISKNISTHRDISRVVRTNFDKNSTAPFEFSHRPHNSLESEAEHAKDIDVQVRIERTIKLNHYTRAYELEDYTRRTQNQ